MFAGLLDKKAGINPDAIKNKRRARLQPCKETSKPKGLPYENIRKIGGVRKCINLLSLNL